MKVKTTVNLLHGRTWIKAGSTVEIEDAVAKDLLKDGHAVQVGASQTPAEAKASGKPQSKPKAKATAAKTKTRKAEVVETDEPVIDPGAAFNLPEAEDSEDDERV